MSENKKLSLADAVKQKLAQKQEQAQGKQENGLVKNTKTLKSQMTKKPSNTRRKMGV
ncbi:hypothetical protein [Peribacillus cavernae]|uniref:hypothetical protein n=1 Tax=Peribacillus cavernae TaxID=1674310 RepID=UPI00163D2080|nr:hypothetical protein [Peribacillus cavernae]MDQ0220171.1 hypothetical protein [Peribacillus cavernae]